MIPNKTEEQILYNQFKFYDLESSGFCTLPNFIKTNDRIGVVLPRIKDFEIIFNYFADPETSLLNYRKFIHEIFDFKGNENNSNNEGNEYEREEDDFVNIMTEKIIYKGGSIVLLDIIKNLQINDFEENQRMNNEEFLKVLQSSKIYFSPEEIKALFRGFDYYENGVVKYQILINILLEQFWDEKKLSLSKEIYYLLTDNGRKDITLNYLKKYFNNVLQDSSEKTYFINFIDEYKKINEINVNKPMNQKDLVKFLKYYNFGQMSDMYLIDLINILRDNDVNDKKQLNNDNKIFRGFKQPKQNEREKKINCYISKGNENLEEEKMNQINYMLRDKFIKFGRKSLFNFLKHFKFYDNNTRCISKYDFSKVLKDFNIKLTVNEIDTIFKMYGTDKVGNSMTYEKFFKDLILSFTSDQRQDVINYIFDTIKERAESLERETDITFLKEMYNPKNNYFKEDETDNKLEFDDCLEIFHYSYNGYKNDDVTQKEFVEFYLFISLIVPSDEDFIFMISNEWRVPLNKMKNIKINKNKGGINLDNLIKIKNSEINKNLSNISNFAQLGENIKDYQGNMYTSPNTNSNNNSNSKPIKRGRALNRKDFGLSNDYYDKYSTYDNNNNKSNIKNYDFPKEEKEESLSLLTDKLYQRGLRGILYLYYQFLSSCPDINKITFDDFANVFKIQHIDLGHNVLKRVFGLFNSNGYLDFYSFIRNYKKELNETKLNSVEQAFTLIDKKGEDRVPLNVIKMRYDAKRHPDVLRGKYTEDEKIMEFIDCFNLCYNILRMDNKEQNNNEEEDYVDFEIFANFYEYVSFIYPRDKEFQNVVTSTWN